jgi:hypothetical protein
VSWWTLAGADSGTCIILQCLIPSYRSIPDADAFLLELSAVVSLPSLSLLSLPLCLKFDEQTTAAVRETRDQATHPPILHKVKFVDPSLTFFPFQADPTQHTISMMELPIRPAAPPSTPLRAKPTLTTLPIDIKHEIFSYLLLGKNVKYSTGGHAPGHSYTFHVKFMRVNKQLYKETYDYLRSRNEFALVHFRYPRLLSGFAPYIEVGKKVKNFREPAIEVTVEDLEPKARWPSHNPLRHGASDRLYVQRVLFLTQDLHHFTRQLQLEIHVWPSSQIYVHPPHESRPLQYTPTVIKNDRKIVWKVNHSHRTDFTRDESRARQERLVAPMTAVFGHGLAVRFPGVDDDIAARTIQSMTPRLVSIDAVGWNLLENMQTQKHRLDECLVHGFGEPHDMIQAYVLTAQLAYNASHAWPQYAHHYNTALLLNTPYAPEAPVKPPLVGSSFRAGALRDTPTDIWLHGIATLGVECILNAMGLALETGNYVPLLTPDISRTACYMASMPHCHASLRQELLDTAYHYHALSQVLSDAMEHILDDDHVNVAIFDLENGPFDDREDEYILEDIKCLSELVRVRF